MTIRHRTRATAHQHRTGDEFSVPFTRLSRFVVVSNLITPSPFRTIPTPRRPSRTTITCIRIRPTRRALTALDIAARRR
jgi:hypothetical protein